MKTFVCALLSILASVACTGCFSVDLKELAKEPPIKQRYLFDIELPASSVKSSDATAILLVEQARAASPYNARPFVYRTGGDTHVADFYNEFLISPAEQISQIVRSWLRTGGGFAHVIDSDSSLVADLTLELDVIELRGDFRDTARPRAVFAMRASLLRTGPGLVRPEVRMQKEYTAAVAIPQATAADLVTGWNRGITQVLTELTQDVQP